MVLGVLAFTGLLVVLIKSGPDSWRAQAVR